ncbi:hypothetical protein ACN38_g6532 [Penicillium nordicum]|uniref:Uncharacterized protein n=1 Tax=Penicillium nordicum TaxID=229535 RepID=A0A0M8P0D6_9EURO|nr:hypothetical protein ACN38_g6532 [Penicillium nordicum]
MLGELKVQLTERGETYYVLVNIHSCCYFFCLFLVTHPAKWILRPGSLKRARLGQCFELLRIMPFKY